jgi:6,7-dimethyl-8-ribityllumazine synthase
MALVNENLYNIETGILQKDACIVIVHTEWNPEIVDKLLNGCIKILNQFGMNNYKIIEVPGVFEIPFAIKNCWEVCNKNPAFKPVEKPKVFIALGCVLRGGTPHFDYVCKAVTEGVLHLNLTLPVPTIFGILTVEDQQQAEERTGGVHGHKGEEAAISALKMITLKYPNQ